MELRLREIREHNDLTQRKMASILKISKSYYNYFETGERIIPVIRLNDFCNYFHVSFDYVLGLSKYNIVTKKNIKLDIKVISSRIKEIRKKKKLKQKDLAKMFNTSQSTISAYENGKTMILTAFLFEICSKLKVSADYLVGRSNTTTIYLRPPEK